MTDTPLPPPGSGRSLFFGFIDQLRAEREARGEEPLTDADVAKFLGVAPGSFAGWRTKTRPALESRRLIEAWTGGVVHERAWDTEEERSEWLTRESKIAHLTPGSVHIDRDSAPPPAAA